jgi:signal transduction histidine kinase
MKKKPNFILLFYFLVGYVILQFFWWAYLLINLSVELIQAKAPFNDYTAEDVLILSRNKTWMILGEGSVFIILLAIGLYQIRKSIIKEVALAQQQQNFMMAVTHELKSPLAAIKLQLQTLLKRENLTPDQQKLLLNNAAADADRLTNLTENILTATNIEQAQLQLLAERINLAAFIDNLINTYQFNTNLGFSVNVNESHHVKADRNALISVFTNMVDNSIKYANKDCLITIQSEVKNDCIHITYQDEGPGFNNIDTKLVFNQFYRGGNELTRSAKGTGLGLFIVKQLLLQMGGHITIKPNDTKGASFLIDLPLAKG